MIPDYHDLWRAHEREQAKELERLPVCYECDEPIQDEVCYEFDGELLCLECLKDNHRRRTEDYIEEEE